MLFKAAILVEQKAPLVVSSLEVARKLMEGQVLVKIKEATICGAQRGEWMGTKGPDKFLPHLMGHEGAGFVVAVGPGVTQVTPNDYVVLHWRKGFGINADCPKYYWPARDVWVGAGNVTTFSEYAIVSENRMTRVSQKVPPTIASLLGCAVTTGFGLVQNEAQLKMGQSIIVVGCGGVGLSVIQGAAMVGGYPIIGIDKSAGKGRLARQLGATEFFSNVDLSGVTETKQPRADVVVETTGVPKLINAALQMVQPGGRLVLVGQPPVGADVVITNMAQHYKGKTILDSQGGLTNPAVDIPRYARLYLDGCIDLDSIVTAKYPLEHINAAMDHMADTDVGRIGLEVQQ